MSFTNFREFLKESSDPLKELWAILISSGHKLTKDNWNDINVEKEFKIDLKPDMVEMINKKFSKNFIATAHEIKMK